jgi:hypothetical protein
VDLHTRRSAAVSVVRDAAAVLTGTPRLPRPHDACRACANVSHRSICGEDGDAIRIAGKSASATRHRRVRLQRALRAHLQRLRPEQLTPFPRAISNEEAPLLSLDYRRWTRISPEHALPYGAHVDWIRGVARAPAMWELRLPSTSFVLCYESARAGAAAQHIPIALDSSDAFVLQDVRATMTVAEVLQHVQRWLRGSACPKLHHHVHLSELCLALEAAPDGKPPSSPLACASPAPSSATTSGDASPPHLPLPSAPPLSPPGTCPRAVALNSIAQRAENRPKKTRGGRSRRR